VFTPTSPGRYEVVVAYYMQGQSQWEDEGEGVFIVDAPAVSIPVPPVVPAPVAPQSVPSAPAVVPAPLTPVGGAAPQAKISLVKTADVKVAAAGSLVRYTLTVKDTSSTTADDVKLCDALPAGTLYVSASRKAAFSGRAPSRQARFVDGRGCGLLDRARAAR
jgi:uncharacterized repeat protein (TIGR01451 family)